MYFMTRKISVALLLFCVFGAVHAQNLQLIRVILYMAMMYHL